MFSCVMRLSNRSSTVWSSLPGTSLSATAAAKAVSTPPACLARLGEPAPCMAAAWMGTGPAPDIDGMPPGRTGGLAATIVGALVQTSSCRASSRAVSPASTFWCASAGLLSASQHGRGYKCSVSTLTGVDPSKGSQEDEAGDEARLRDRIRVGVIDLRTQPARAAARLPMLLDLLERSVLTEPFTLPPGAASRDGMRGGACPAKTPCSARGVCSPPHAITWPVPAACGF
mmetsp:Transcript_26473/g.61730  ORF Transcript_26473/g.61730 Transcript_26473/m.61730 type:complete len:229 (+) Transcript_26473:2598-3284(+)